MVYAWPLARITGGLTCGFGRYGIVAPFGGDWNETKHGRERSLIGLPKRGRRERLGSTASEGNYLEHHTAYMINTLCNLFSCSAECDSAFSWIWQHFTCYLNGAAGALSDLLDFRAALTCQRCAHARQKRKRNRIHQIRRAKHKTI